MRPQGEIPEGFCQCGCGERTNLMPCSDARSGRVRGKPFRFVHNHHRRLSGVEYIEVDHGYTTPCWDWQRDRSSSGYGRVGDPATGKLVLAHRRNWEQVNGPIPSGLEIDHLCRNRACVNPDHLEAVTPAENVRRNTQTCLTVEKVRRIKQLLTTHSDKQLGAQFAVSPATIWQIRTGRNWRDV